MRSSVASLAALAILSLTGAAGAQTAAAGAAAQAEDAAVFCRFVADEYAYFDLKATDWPAVCGELADDMRKPMDRDTFVAHLERALRELYDDHAHLGTNTAASYRLVPSQSDVIAAWRGDRAVVTAVRRGSSAERAGVAAGDEIVAIDGEPTAQAGRGLEPRHLRHPDPAARDAALAVVLAGRHERTRQRLTLRAGGTVREVELERSGAPAPTPMSFRRMGAVGVVRVHDSLGDLALVAAFDAALAAAPDAAALVIDLRDTPRGGTSTVARGLLSRLVTTLRPYQRHEQVGEFRSSGIRRVWVEQVAPRGTPFRGPVVVLVGRWTGSMGEGLAIGLNGAVGAPVIGTPMARLLGALGEVRLPNAGIVVRVPVEKLFHVDGTPREAFVPCAVDASMRDADAELTQAVALARALAARPSSVHRVRGCPVLPRPTSERKAGP